MARGWESKSVENQQELREAAREEAAAAKLQNHEDAERRRKRESLESSRKRVLHDIENAKNPRYKLVLDAALAHLDQQLSELNAGSS